MEKTDNKTQSLGKALKNFSPDFTAIVDAHSKTPIVFPGVLAGVVSLVMYFQYINSPTMLLGVLGGSFLYGMAVSALSKAAWLRFVSSAWENHQAANEVVTEEKLVKLKKLFMPLVPIYSVLMLVGVTTLLLSFTGNSFSPLHSLLSLILFIISNATYAIQGKVILSGVGYFVASIFAAGLAVVTFAG